MSSLRPTLRIALALAVCACGGHSPATPAEKEAAPALAASTSPAPQPVLAAIPTPPPSPTPPPASPPEPVARAQDPTPGPLTPLTAEQRTLLRAGPEDPLTPTPIHYMKSNEVRHDVWFPYIAGKGGALLGVGSDQNYTLAAVARSEFLFLADIDQSVADLHRNYEVLIEASPDPASLVEKFQASATESSIALLTAAYADLPEPERRRLIRLYRNARETVRIHVERVIKRKQDGEPTTWLSDATLYDHIRAMFLADRVRPMAGNLIGPNSLQTAATAARALGTTIRVVYFSNAEEYFMYVPQFVANVEALPVDDGTVVLRTIYSKEWVHADQLWAYQVQPMSDYKARLARRVSGRNSLLVKVAADGTLNKETGTKGLSLISMPVAPASK
jgi:hypothetical protein